MKRPRPFYQFNTGTPGILFFRLVDELRDHIDVKFVGAQILEDAERTKESLTRFACRFIPVDFLIKAKQDNFIEKANPIMAKAFAKPKEGEDF